MRRVLVGLLSTCLLAGLTGPVQPVRAQPRPEMPTPIGQPCGVLSVRTGPQMQRMAEAGVDTEKLGFPAGRIQVRVDARGVGCDQARRVLRRAFDPDNYPGLGFLGSPQGWQCGLSEASPSPIGACHRAGGSGLIGAFLTPGQTGSGDGGARRCGIVRTAADYPARVLIHRGRLDCAAATRVFARYYQVLPQRAEGQGGGGSVPVSIGGRDWVCGSGPSTNPYSECRSPGMLLEAVIVPGSEPGDRVGNGPGGGDTPDQTGPDSSGQGGFLPSLWDALKNGGAFAGGFAKGFGQQLWTEAKGLWNATKTLGCSVLHLCSHDKFKQTWAGYRYLVTHPIDSLKRILGSTLKPLRQAWADGDYGESIGRGTALVLSAVFGGKGLTKLGKLGKLDPPGRRSGELGGLAKAAQAAQNAARRAAQAADNGNVAAARRAANQADRHADTAARKARAKGCRLGALTLPSTTPPMAATVPALVPNGGRGRIQHGPASGDAALLTAAPATLALTTTSVPHAAPGNCDDARQARQDAKQADIAVTDAVAAARAQRALEGTHIEPGVERHGGGFIDTTRKSFDLDERKIAELLATEGNYVEGIPEGATRTGDAYVNGKVTEFKTIKGERIKGSSDRLPPTWRTVRGALNSAKGQARRAFLDCRGADITQAEARRGLREFLASRHAKGRMDDVRIVGDDWSITGPKG